MPIYTNSDAQTANAAYAKSKKILIVLSIVALLCYGVSIALHIQWLMLGIFIVGFMVFVFYLDMFLLPKKRYNGFLRALEAGRRHSSEAVIESIEDEICIQDGAPVRLVHVHLPDIQEDKHENGERLFYLKAETALPLNTPLTLECYGRHIAAWSRQG